jgi:hypothetical protein
VPPGGEGHAVELFEWTSGSKHLNALALPHNRLSDAEIAEEPKLAGSEGYMGEITALALSGTQAAYTRVWRGENWTGPTSRSSGLGSSHTVIVGARLWLRTLLPFSKTPALRSPLPVEQRSAI